jgi:hypothetical protein
MLYSNSAIEAGIVSGAVAKPSAATVIWQGQALPLQKIGRDKPCSYRAVRVLQ